MIKVATPVSHFFNNKEDAEKILRHSDCLECRDHTRTLKFAKEEIYHCELQPIHRWDAAERSLIRNIASTKKSLKLISFHLGSSYHKPPIVDAMYQPRGFSYSRKALLENARKNIAGIRKIFGPAVGIAVENNNFYPTGAYTYVTDADFIGEIVKENRIGLLLDMAHAYVTAHNRRLKADLYISCLPLDRVVQIHLSKYKINQRVIAYDAHAAPTRADWRKWQSTVEQCPRLRYASLEIYQTVAGIIRGLKRLRGWLDELS